MGPLFSSWEDGEFAAILALGVFLHVYNYYCPSLLHKCVWVTLGFGVPTAEKGSAKL